LLPVGLLLGTSFLLSLWYLLGTGHDSAQAIDQSPEPQRSSERPSSPTVLTPALRLAEPDEMSTTEASAGVDLEAPPPIATDNVGTLLRSVSDSFLTNVPDLNGLNQALYDLVALTSVIDESVTLNAVDGSVTGRLEVKDSSLQGSFRITGDGHCSLQFDTTQEVQPPFFRRDLVVSFDSDPTGAKQIGTSVQFNPNTTPTGYTALMATLTDQENYAGWDLSVGLDGTIGHPIAMRRGSDGASVYIGKSEVLPPLDANWANDIRVYEQWRLLLSGYAPSR